MGIVLRIMTCVGLLALTSGCREPIARHFDPPAPTAWQPEGCLLAPGNDAAADLPTGYSRTTHSDMVNSDEFALAVAPMFAHDPNWTQPEDQKFFVPEGPSFDRDGNVYFTPLWPEEQVILVSLNPDTGKRNWTIPGTCDGAGSPLVLRGVPARADKDGTADDVIYVGTYSEALAVSPDGTILWRMPTGLDALPERPEPYDHSRTPSLGQRHCFGLNYLPQANAVVGVTGNGYIYALNRFTGEPLLDPPYCLPGAPVTEAITPNLPDALWERIEEELRALMGGAPITEGRGLGYELLQVLQGGNIEVANFFAIDPHTGRIWVAATALDDYVDDLGNAEPADGISEHGALYGLDLVQAKDGAWSLEQAAAYYFDGGSASTPTLSADGRYIYVGDSEGNLLALSADGSGRKWDGPANVGNQIMGSVSISDDGTEIYAATQMGLFRVLDKGDHPEVDGSANLDMAYRYMPTGLDALNLLLAGTAANGIAVQIGAGYSNLDAVLEIREDDQQKDGKGAILPLEFGLPLNQGVALLDRETLDIRYFALGGEESVSVICVGPDGCVYLGNSPFRRAVLRAVRGHVKIPPLAGGIGKYAAVRLDLLARDAVCAAADRATNAIECATDETAWALRRRIEILMDQTEDAVFRALPRDDMSPWCAVTLLYLLDEARTCLDANDFTGTAQWLNAACDVAGG